MKQMATVTNRGTGTGVSPRRAVRSSRLIRSDERLREGHRRIVESVTPLLIDRGFHKTSIRDISEAVGWSMGTLYLYIKKKEEVLHLVSEEVMLEFDRCMSELPVEADRQRHLVNAIREFFRFCDEFNGQIRLLYREFASMLKPHMEIKKRHELEMRDVFARILMDGVREGVFEPHDCSLIAYDVVMLGHMWALKGWDLRSRLSVKDYTDLQTRVLLRAIVPPGTSAEERERVRSAV